MSWLQILQIVVMALSLLVSVGTSIFLALIGYMMKRRDKEIEQIASDVRETSRVQADHAVKIERLFGEVRSFGDIRSELTQIRETLVKYATTLARIEQRLDDRREKS